jgi:alpha-galactosidase
MKALSVLSPLLSAALVVLAYPICASGQLAQTPPMGWSSWNAFGLNITDSLIRAQAAALVSSGMQAVGYTYVNIDDGWQATTRDGQGNIQANPTTFPDMGGLASYVHGLGLKIGILSSAGPKTCNGNIGSLGYEAQDAATFASWGIDYLKYEWCSCTTKLCGTPQKAFLKMYNAIQTAGRPMVYKISTFGQFKPWLWASSVGVNAWGTGYEMQDDFFVMAELSFGNDGLEKFAGPKVQNGNGGWNDPDMLEVGNGGEKTNQYQTQMSIWAIQAAPLIAGNDLTTMNSTTVAQLTNPDIIAVDQDSLGKQGHRVWQVGPEEIWVKPMADGSVVVGLFNRVAGTAYINLPFDLVGVKGTVDAVDLWQQKNLGIIKNNRQVLVGSYGATMLRLTMSQ